MSDLPSGTVTFLYTDIEGSTPMWDRNPQAMQVSLERHNAILKRAIEAHDGKIFKVIGDAFQAAFVAPVGAVKAAVAAQRALAQEEWAESGPIRVRMGIHAGPAEASEGDYISSSHQTLNRVARIMAAGHGGQILISLTVEELIRSRLLEGVTLKDLGEHYLRGLAQPERVYQVVAPDLQRDFPPLATRTVEQHNLPVEATPFVGREAEIANLGALVQDPACRLVTVLGPGGMGKSRLAVQVGHELVTSFPHGVWFVPLAPLRAAEHMPSTTATALKLPLSGQVRAEEQLINYLQEKKILIILDNYEHLLPEGVELPLALLQNAPGLKLLVTSRERLGLQGEWIFELQGLDFPKNGMIEKIESYDAVNLFLQHARKVARFPFSEAEKGCVAQISQLVEGMPLAIVLAASWTSTLNCDSILREVRSNLHFLESGLRDVPERHRSIQAVFEQSWKLLNREEQSIFKRLSIFRGGFDREAAEEIAVASLRVLAALVDKSLLHREPNGRYQIHELLRQYASDKLEESPEGADHVRNLHCAYYSDYLYKRYPDMVGGRQQEAVQEIAEDLQNIRTAWQWAIENSKVKELHKSAGSLFYFCQVKCYYQEGVEGAENAIRSLESIPADDVRDQTLVDLLTYLGWLYIRLGKLDQAREVLKRSRQIYQKYDPTMRMESITDPASALGILEVILGNYSRAAELGEESRRVNESRGDQWNLMFSYYVLANATLAQGEYEKARQAAESAYAIAEARNERWFRAYILIDLGNVARAQGDYEQARQHYQESYRLREEFHDSEGMAVALNHLGEIAILQEDYALAEEFYQRSIAAYQGIGDRGGLATALNGLGRAARCLGKVEAARRHYHEALQIAAQIQFLPLMISVLINISILFLEARQNQRAAEVLVMVLDHPAIEQMDKERVWKILADYEDQIPLQALRDARAGRPREEFDAMVEALEGELLAT
jgi:predicted ATPase/class 3 adenylate cyclase